MPNIDKHDVDAY